MKSIIAAGRNLFFANCGINSVMQDLGYIKEQGLNAETAEVAYKTIDNYEKKGYISHNTAQAVMDNLNTDINREIYDVNEKGNIVYKFDDFNPARQAELQLKSLQLTRDLLNDKKVNDFIRLWGGGRSFPL